MISNQVWSGVGVMFGREPWGVVTRRFQTMSATSLGPTLQVPSPTLYSWNAEASSWRSLCPLYAAGISARTISMNDTFCSSVTRGRRRLRISLLECGVTMLWFVFEAQRIIYSRWAVIPRPFRTETFRIWGRGVELLPLVNQWILLREALTFIALPLQSSWKQEGSYKSNSEN